VQNWINEHTQPLSLSITNRYYEIGVRVNPQIPDDVQNILMNITDPSQILIYSLTYLMNNPSITDADFLSVLITYITSNYDASGNSIYDETFNTQPVISGNSVSGFQNRNNFEKREGFLNNYASIANENGSAVAWHSKISGSPFSL
jgi:hypothetical protein